MGFRFYFCVILLMVSLDFSSSFRMGTFSGGFRFRLDVSTQELNTFSSEISAKSVTKEIMTYFSAPVKKSFIADDKKFQQRLTSVDVKKHVDGMHVITILFLCARSKRKAKNILPVELMVESLQNWNRSWTERDISTFVYGVRSIDGLNSKDGSLLQLGAKKISESTATLSSRAIGNALYGLQDITSDTVGAPELCAALAAKIAGSEVELSGQDIGIGIYGLQGMSADNAAVRQLVGALAQKIDSSVTEFDAQALSNALYGLQSLSSDHAEVRALVGALATKVSESSPVLSAQAIGNSLYGLQKLSSDALEVRTLLAALSEKIGASGQEQTTMDPQAIGNAFFGLQRMNSNAAEVRTLLGVLAERLTQEQVKLDSDGIGAALYGLHSMSSDSPQVRAVLGALAVRISGSDCFLGGQAIADSLYGLANMRTDCGELRSLLGALAERIDSSRGKLDSQEIGNSLFGFQSLSSDLSEVRQIASKLADKIKRSDAILRSQHIGRAILGMQRLSADSTEIRYLLRQVTRRIADSDRIRMTGQAISEALYGLQGMNSVVPEVQDLISELAKKVSSTGASLTPVQLGNALFGLQGLSSSASIFRESAIGLDSDEVQFLLSTLWDKTKNSKNPVPLYSVAMGLQGLILLNDPIANNLRQFLYSNIVRMKDLSYLVKAEQQLKSDEAFIINPNSDEFPKWTVGQAVAGPAPVTVDVSDIISVVRVLNLNGADVPAWLAEEYKKIEEAHKAKPLLPAGRAEKLITQKFAATFPSIEFTPNALLEGFRMDMLFPEIKLNVELDGPSHAYPSRARFDKQRDEYLAKLDGFDVLRIKLMGKSNDEVIKIIKQRVDERLNMIEEIKIQRLYARDELIQRIYAKEEDPVVTTTAVAPRSYTPRRDSPAVPPLPQPTGSEVKK